MANTKMNLMLEYAEKTEHFELSDKLENVLMELYVKDPAFFTEETIGYIEFLGFLCPRDISTEMFIANLYALVNSTRDPDEYP